MSRYCACLGAGVQQADRRLQQVDRRVEQDGRMPRDRGSPPPTRRTGARSAGQNTYSILERTRAIPGEKRVTEYVFCLLERGREEVLDPADSVHSRSPHPLEGVRPAGLAAGASRAGSGGRGDARGGTRGQPGETGRAHLLGGRSQGRQYIRRRGGRRLSIADRCQYINTSTADSCRPLGRQPPDGAAESAAAASARSRRSSLWTVRRMSWKNASGSAPWSGG